MAEVHVINIGGNFVGHVIGNKLYLILLTLLEVSKKVWLNNTNHTYQFMLSTQYRLRLEGICKDIASGTQVSIDDMIWAQKLAKANTSARGMLSKARRMATDPDGSCLKFLDIGDPRTDKKGFNGADDIADWFKNDRSDVWRQRD